MRALNSSKSPGADRIPVQILKAATSVETTDANFQCILERSIFPHIWKLARIIPIYKTGTETVVKNYWPISVLSVVWEISEKIVRDRLMEYLKGQNKFI